jgi:hypothetical protein
VGARVGVVGVGGDIAHTRTDAVVVGLSRKLIEDALHFIREVRLVDQHVAVVAAAGRLTAGEVVALMRAGATDVLILPLDTGEVGARLLGAVERTRAARYELERSDRLARICRRLSDERREVADQVEQMSAEMVGAYQHVADGVGHANVGAQFGVALSDELDVEHLLRKTLEFVLDRIGIVNAVVLLPNSSGDWAVGAYVNADMPEGSIDLMLDQLADVLPPAFAGEEWLVQLDGAGETEAALGESAAEWLQDRSTLVLPCDHVMGDTTERIAILAAFRHGRFSNDVTDEVRTIGEVFAAHLAKVVRIHNRTATESAWFGFDVGAPGSGGQPDDDAGDAADWWKDAA